MDFQTKKSIIAELLRAGRPELANVVAGVVTAAKMRGWWVSPAGKLHSVDRHGGHRRFMQANPKLMKLKSGDRDAIERVEDGDYDKSEYRAVIDAEGRIYDSGWVRISSYGRQFAITIGNLTSSVIRRIQDALLDLKVNQGTAEIETHDQRVDFEVPISELLVTTNPVSLMRGY